jgi:hypothetical protein
MAITINASAYQTGSNAVAATTLVLSSVGAVVAGQYTFVAVAIATTTATISAITDNLGNIYSQRSWLQNAAGVRTELWAAPVTFPGSINTLTITVSPASLMAACVVAYAGISALGNIETAGGTGTMLVDSLTTQDAYNWNVAAFGFVCASGDTLTATLGAIRERYLVPALTSVGCALIYATYSGPGLSILTATLSASRAWAVAGVELRTNTSFGGFNDIPAAPPNVPLASSVQIGSVAIYLEPPFNASAPIAASGSSGATFF